MLAVQIYNAIRYKHASSTEVEDTLTTEAMLQILVNEEPFTITMRTPGDEEALCRGILFTENVFTEQNIQPQYTILERDEENVISRINVSIPIPYLQEGIQQKRNLLSVSSCGVCGKYDLDLRLHGILQDELIMDIPTIPNLFAQMAERQVQFKESGGCHAAALCTIDGQLLDCKEDIGRHNAVDKTIGSLLRQQRLHEANCLLVSGRVSYEIVSKAHRAGIAFLCSVSAPSSMAVEYCKQSGIALIAFCREDRFTVYANAQRMRGV